MEEKTVVKFIEAYLFFYLSWLFEAVNTGELATHLKYKVKYKKQRDGLPGVGTGKDRRTGYLE